MSGKPGVLSKDGITICLHVSLLVCLMTFSPGVLAQNGDQPYTIHVMTRLMQIPTLVLSPSHKPLPPIKASRFWISLDKGTPFQPENVRIEQEDPISLGVLIDTSGDQDELLAELPAALVSLVPGSLHPQDRLELFTISCDFLHQTQILDANYANLQKVAKNLLSQPPQKADGTPCSRSLRFVDTIAVVMKSMSTWPGRRVLLTVADGHDDSSQLTLDSVKLFASRSAVAVFNVSQPLGLYPRQWNSQPASTPQALSAFCEMTGGMKLPTTPEKLPETLKEFVSLLRGRYVIEFHWPGSAPEGMHEMHIKIDGISAFIRPAGSSQPNGTSRSLSDLQQTQPDSQNPAVPVSPPAAIEH